MDVVEMALNLVGLEITIKNRKPQMTQEGLVKNGVADGNDIQQ